MLVLVQQLSCGDLRTSIGTTPLVRKGPLTTAQRATKFDPDETLLYQGFTEMIRFVTIQRRLASGFQRFQTVSNSHFFTHPARSPSART